MSKLTPELESDLRAKINPAYADTPGTESHERLAMLTEIDRLRAEVDELRQRLDAQAAPDGWHPIDTAPTNGEVVLVSNGRGVWVAKYKDVYQSGFKPTSPWFSLMLNKDYMPANARRGGPTHWMPLPEAPNQEGKA